jgi:hypothetical protein
MRAVSTPSELLTRISLTWPSTLWRTTYDQKNKVFYFDSATSPNAFWVPLADLDFKNGVPVKKLTMAGGKVYAGNALSKFETATPFKLDSAHTRRPLIVFWRNGLTATAHSSDRLVASSDVG